MPMKAKPSTTAQIITMGRIGNGSGSPIGSVGLSVAAGVEGVVGAVGRVASVGFSEGAVGWLEGTVGGAVGGFVGGTVGWVGGT